MVGSGVMFESLAFLVLRFSELLLRMNTHLFAPRLVTATSASRNVGRVLDRVRVAHRSCRTNMHLVSSTTGLVDRLQACSIHPASTLR